MTREFGPRATSFVSWVTARALLTLCAVWFGVLAVDIGPAQSQGTLTPQSWVRFPAFRIPVVSENGVRRAAEVTLIAVLENPKKSKSVCNKTPRIMSAVTQTFYDYPVHTSGITLKTRKTMGPLLKAMQANGGKKVITGVKLFAGAPFINTEKIKDRWGRKIPVQLYNCFGGGRSR